MRVLMTLLVAVGLATPLQAEPLPQPYVRLRDVDATIVQDMRYAGRHNFLGRVVPGYDGADCIVTRPTAEALRRVQQSLSAMRLSIKVYDCYRPVRAVRTFEAWAEDTADTAMRAEFYPDLDKRKLFSLGYISRNSTHSRGNTVDLTLVPLGSTVPPRADDAALQSCAAPRGARSADNSLDFGTAYDCFSPLSNTAHPAITGEARRNRALLVARMKAQGFRNYSKEWWHFDLPGAGTEPQDFAIPPPQ